MEAGSAKDHVLPRVGGGWGGGEVRGGGMFSAVRQVGREYLGSMRLPPILKIRSRSLMGLKVRSSRRETDAMEMLTSRRNG